MKLSCNIYFFWCIRLFTISIFLEYIFDFKFLNFFN